MRKILLALTAVVLLAGAFVSGFLVADRGAVPVLNAGPDPRLARQVIAELHAMRDPERPAPETWVYPKANSVGRGGGLGSTSTTEALQVTFDLARYQKLTTTDDFDTVVRWYEERCAQALKDLKFDGAPDLISGKGDPKPRRRGEGAGGVVHNGRHGGVFHVLDCHEPDAPDRERKTLSSVIGLRMNTYSFNAFITRAEDAKYTHILLTFDHWAIEPRTK